MTPMVLDSVAMHAPLAGSVRPKVHFITDSPSPFAFTSESYQATLLGYNPLPVFGLTVRQSENGHAKRPVLARAPERREEM